jgi:hypothetical protein
MKFGTDNLNQEFLKCLERSFLEYLKEGPQSTAKLKILHPCIAKDLKNLLGDKYQIYSLDEKNGKEKTFEGRYMDKRIDIAVMKGKEQVAGLAVKFIMSNYSQNSNNYFESMLGETANLRTNDILYFQIVICFAYPPYYNNKKGIEKIEEVKLKHLKKYQKLSRDNVFTFLHSPIKTLLILVDFNNIDCKKLFEENKLKSDKDLAQIVKEKNPNLLFSNLESDKENEKTIFEKSLIFNNYQDFIKKCVQLIEGFF